MLLAVTAAASWPIAGRRASLRTLMNQPVAPFRIIGNIYYVGVSGVSSFLIATPEGAILVDGGLKESAPHIARSIASLGFRITDVKYLLNSHLHYDHAGGFAELKRRSGAVMVMGVDAPWLMKGSDDVPPVQVDRLIADGDTVQVGGTTLVAHLTPGHTRGCTTWTTTTIDDGRPYRVVIHCSTNTIDTGRIVGNPRYPEVVADYEHTFDAVRKMPCDVFLHVHPQQFDMFRKRTRLRPGAPNPFVDPTALARHNEESEREFRMELARQQAELARGTF